MNKMRRSSQHQPILPIYHTEKLDPAIESENNRATENLSDKVHSLKLLSIQMESELRDQNMLLMDNNDNLDASSVFLDKATRGVKKLSEIGRKMGFAAYLILFILLVVSLFWMKIKFT